MAVALVNVPVPTSALKPKSVFDDPDVTVPPAFAPKAVFLSLLVIFINEWLPMAVLFEPEPTPSMVSPPTEVFALPVVKPTMLK